MNGVPVARRMIAPGNDAGMYIARAPSLGRVHALVVAAEQDQRRRRRAAPRAPPALSGFTPALRANGEGAGHAHLVLEEVRMPRA